MAERLQRVRFENRKESILKRGRELSTLCGVKLCLMIVSPNGKVETWPQNLDDVKAILGAANAAPSVKKVSTNVALSESTLPDQPTVKDNPRKRRRNPLRQKDIPIKKTKITMGTADSTHYNVGSDSWNNVNGFGSIPMWDAWNQEDGSFTVGMNNIFEKNLYQDLAIGHDLQIEEDTSMSFKDYGKDLELQQQHNQLWVGDPFGGNGFHSGATMAPPPPQGFAGGMFDPLINEQPLPALRQCGSIGLENTLLRDFY